MCCSHNRMYIFDQNNQSHLKVLDFKFDLHDKFLCRVSSSIPIGIHMKNCDVDMCVIPNSSLNRTECRVRRRSLSGSSSHSPVDLSDDGQHRFLAEDHLIVLSKSAPDGLIVALDVKGNVIWRLDYRTHQYLDEGFSPICLSSSAAGDIFAVDHNAHKVGT